MMGGTRQQVALGIESSPEYEQLVVQQLYMQYLHRSADPVGLAAYTAMLAEARPPNRLRLRWWDRRSFSKMREEPTAAS